MGCAEELEERQRKKGAGQDRTSRDQEPADLMKLREMEKLLIGASGREEFLAHTRKEISSDPADRGGTCNRDSRTCHDA